MPGPSRLFLTKYEYSQTVASTLTFLLYHLAREPVYVEKLRAEVKLDRVFDPRELQSLEYLNAVINETLRLYPPVLSSLHRDTPPEGLTVAGRYIPGNTTVITPSYSLARRQLPPSLRLSEGFPRLIRHQLRPVSNEPGSFCLSGGARSRRWLRIKLPLHHFISES
jgi:Cytochrome P450